MDLVEWTKHKKFISEKKSNFEKRLNFTYHHHFTQISILRPLLASGRGLFKYEENRFFFRVARKIYKSDYITGPNRLEGVMTFFEGNRSILNFKNFKTLKLLLLLPFCLLLPKKRGGTLLDFEAQNLNLAHFEAWTRAIRNWYRIA